MGGAPRPAMPRRRSPVKPVRRPPFRRGSSGRSSRGRSSVRCAPARAGSVRHGRGCGGKQQNERQDALQEVHLRFSFFGIAKLSAGIRKQGLQILHKRGASVKFRRSGCLKNNYYCLKIVHLSPLKYCRTTNKGAFRSPADPMRFLDADRAIIRKNKDKFAGNDGGPPMKRILPVIFFVLSCTEVLFAATVTDYRRPRYGQPLSNNNITALARDPLDSFGSHPAANWPVSTASRIIRWTGCPVRSFSKAATSFSPWNFSQATVCYSAPTKDFTCWMSAAAGSRSPRR